MNLFKRIFGRKLLKPKDIAFKIGRIMDNTRTESVFKVYVPYRYRVFLSQKDTDRLEPFKSSVMKELTDYINNHAKKKDYHLMGEPEINFVTKESFKEGKFQVEPIFEDDNMDTGEQTVVFDNNITGPVSGQEKTMVFDKNIENNPVLEILEGKDRGSKYTLVGSNITLGRRADNQIRIDDTNVSRYHSRIVYQDGWKIEDLNSTNGLYVNGKKVKESSLQDEDKIRVGSTVLRFRIK